MELVSSFTSLNSLELEEINGGSHGGGLINININAENNDVYVHTEDKLDFPINVDSILIKLLNRDRWFKLF